MQLLGKGGGRSAGTCLSGCATRERCLGIIRGTSLVSCVAAAIAADAAWRAVRSGCPEETAASVSVSDSGRGMRTNANDAFLRCYAATLRRGAARLGFQFGYSAGRARRTSERSSRILEKDERSISYRVLAQCPNQVLHAATADSIPAEAQLCQCLRRGNAQRGGETNVVSLCSAADRELGSERLDRRSDCRRDGALRASEYHENGGKRGRCGLILSHGVLSQGFA